MSAYPSSEIPATSSGIPATSSGIPATSSEPVKEICGCTAITFRREEIRLKLPRAYLESRKFENIKAAWEPVLHYFMEDCRLSKEGVKGFRRSLEDLRSFIMEYEPAKTADKIIEQFLDNLPVVYSRKIRTNARLRPRRPKASVATAVTGKKEVLATAASRMAGGENNWP